MIRYGSPYSSELIGRAKIIQQREDITLRALVEQGLRLALEQYQRSAQAYRFVAVVVGGPEIDPGLTPERGQLDD